MAQYYVIIIKYEVIYIKHCDSACIYCNNYTQVQITAQQLYAADFASSKFLRNVRTYVQNITASPHRSYQSL
jgi:uncharacterized Fe-S radical SAM superfamily protein PflX